MNSSLRRRSIGVVSACCAATAAAACLLLLLPSPAAAAAVWDLSSYSLEKFLKFKEIGDNASGAAYMPESRTLWVVVNNPPGLFHYDLEGRLLRRLDLPWLADPEDVVYISPDTVAVSEEEPGGGIRLLDVSAWGSGRQVGYIPARNPRWGGVGNEGLAYNPRTKTFYVGQEKAPMRILAIPSEGRDAGSWTTVLDGDAAFQPRGGGGLLTDISAVAYTEARPEQLYVLSQESSRVVRVTMGGQVLEHMHVSGLRPEGLVFTPDGCRMIVISEPNEMAIYRSDGCNGKK
ncbi:hypothetical protein HYH02_005033 [Chlamydomonas schloesseri]|uniref:SMP-30/Gluconolactonase/LRE-like region domain-containing protein n=1 Tax=Chlamydomonas schloesseri TaxID=2026947 RepID=A0A836B848_9CHLO|nr:hypothetical protein HYH02_005033 [Chlamydomonas schloesseri]|eukprot:KAG2450532.1 hypothetical protein HYH02_005033 [Chlamydomonas schloesseri]